MHTPGPWRRSARPSGPWWHIGAGNQSVCTVHACSKKHTPVYAAMFKANADLIAAAPDLLDALQRIAEYPITRADELTIEGAREIARVALARALPTNKGD